MCQNVAVNRVVHLPAAENRRADYLSRGGSVEGLLHKDSSLKTVIDVKLNKDELIESCDSKRSTQLDCSLIQCVPYIRTV